MLGKEICTWFLTAIERRPGWLESIWFIDESHFTLSPKANYKTVFSGVNPPPNFVYEKPLHDQVINDVIAWDSPQQLRHYWTFLVRRRSWTDSYIYNRQTHQHHQQALGFPAMEKARFECMVYAGWGDTARRTLHWLGGHFEGQVVNGNTKHFWAPHILDLNPLDYFV